MQIYPYQQLRLTNSTLPPGVDKNALEVCVEYDCSIALVNTILMNVDLYAVN